VTETLGKRARTGFLWLAAANIASKGCQMAVILVLAAFLTESDLGAVTVAIALVNVAQVVQTMGVYEVIGRTERDEKAIAGTVLTMSLGASIVLTVVGLTRAQWIADVLGVPEASSLVAVVAISLPFTAIGGVQMALMHRTLDFRRRLFPDAGSSIVGALVTIGLAVLGTGAMSLAVGLVCMAVLQPFFSFLVGVRVWPTWNRAAAAESSHWIGIVGPGALVAGVLLNIDSPTISRILGADAVGLYSLAFRIAWLPFVLIAMVLAAVAFPVYSTMIRDDRRPELPVAVGRFTQAVLLLAGGMYVIVALMADRVELLGLRWAPAAPTLRVLCVYGIGLSLLATWYEVLIASRRLGQYLCFEITRLVLLVAALFFFTRYGITAAACAQLIAVWCVIPVVWVAMVRAKVAPPIRDVVRGLVGFLAPALACVAFVFILRWSDVGLDPTSRVGSIVELVVLVSCYVVVGAATNRPLVASFRQRQKCPR